MESIKLFIPEAENEFSDEDFFKSLDKKFSNLKTKKAVVDYFKNRRNVPGIYDFRNNEDLKAYTENKTFLWQQYSSYSKGVYAYIIDAGKLLLSNKYLMTDGVVHDLGDNLENFPVYSYNSISKINQGFHIQFTRGYLFESLALYYHETHDVAAVDKFQEILEKFFEVYNLKVEEKSKSGAWFQYSHNRESMNVGWLIINYINLLYTDICYHEKINTDLIFEMIKRMYFLALQFRRYDDDVFQHHNHHLFERGIVPYYIAKMLPEFPELKCMEERGKSVIKEHIRRDFTASGKSSEHSIGYFLGATICEMLSKVIILMFNNNDVFFDKEEREIVNSLFDIACCLPYSKDEYPVVGDQGYIPTKVIVELGKMLGNKKCFEFEKQRKHDKCGNYNESRNFNDAGYVVLKSGCGKKDSYILMSAIDKPIGSGHDHLDMLSVILQINGKVFFDEPYAAKLYKHFVYGHPLRGYLYNQTSHNNVLAYGKPIVDDEYFTKGWFLAKPDTKVEKFEKNEKYAFVSAYHTGYMFSRVQRDVYLSDEKIEITDIVYEGARIDKYHISRWHLDKDVQVSKISSNKYKLVNGEVSLICELDGDFEKAEIYKNEKLSEIFKEDELGLIMDVYFKINENAQLLKRNAELTMRITKEEN